MKKKRGTTKSADKRHQLRIMEDMVRATTRQAAELREKIRHGPAKGRMLPKEGSRWSKHPAFAARHEVSQVWTFLMWAWGGHANNDQLAVLETEIDGKPYRRAVEMGELFVEFVPVPVKRGARS